MRTRSHTNRHVRSALAAGVALALVVTGMTGTGPAAAAPDPSSDQPAVVCPAEVSAGGTASAATEPAAVALAQACDLPVEVASARGFAQRTLAQPSGTLRSEFYAMPRWARDASGAWVEVDPSLVRAADGSLRSAATVSPVEISGGGSGPFVTVTDPGGGALSLAWPEPLPAPDVAGDTATYPEVLPGVDLRVTAGVDGFSYGLVVHTRAAAANPALARVAVQISGDGLAVSQEPEGRVVATGAGGEPVFWSGPALMWDSSAPAGAPATGAGPGAAPPGRMARMPVQLSGGTLAVLPDQQLLADPDTVFPVVIDPPFTASRNRWATVHKAQPNRGWTDNSSWPRAGGMRVGLCTWSNCADATGVWRSVVRFSIKDLAGRYVLDAKLKMTQTHTGGCGGPYPLKLYRVSSFNSGVSWNGVNWLSHIQTRDVPRSNCGSGNQGVVFSGVESRVRDAADNGNRTISFGVRSGNESTRNQWRRISVSRSTLLLEVEHHSFPRTPTNRSTDGKGCDTSAPGPWLTTDRPVLSAKPRNADGKGKLRVRIREHGSSQDHYRHTTGVITVNRIVSHRIPSGDRLADGRYRWSARTVSPISAVPASPYSSWCYFRVDTTPPPAPSATQLTAHPKLGDPAQFRLTGSPDTARFRYALTGGSSQTVSASGGTATITVDPPDTSIDHELQVWARDAAGNESARHDKWFTTEKDMSRMPVAGVWRFDGDWRDDSGHEHTLSLQPGVSLATDRLGRPGSAVQLDGTSCAYTDEPVLRTDQSFTVAAWARPDQADSPRTTIVSQAGEAQTSFRLRTNPSNYWTLQIPSEDSGTPVWQGAISGAEPTGEWQHLAGVYDAAAGRARIYVDGTLADVAEVTPAWNASGPLVVGCAANSGSIGWDEFDGAIDDLVAYPGVLTGERIGQLMAGGPPAGEVSWWPLRGDGADAGPGGQDLTVPAGASYVPDNYGRAGSALSLDGTMCATTTSPALRSDDSFTVAAWARPDDDGTQSMSVVSQSGQNYTVMRLRRSTDNRWSFVVMAADDPDAHWYRVDAPVEATTGGWQHLTGVYDAPAGRIRIYVDGVEQATADAPVTLWRATGPTRVGCAGSASGTWSHFVGAVHDVRVWRGAATPEQVTAVATERVSFWGLDSSGLDGWGGNDLSLIGDYQWVDDRFGFPGSAFELALDGTGWAETTGPVVTTDESFTVSAWVRMDDKSDYRAVVAQAGNQVPSFNLNYHLAADRWQLSMASVDDAGSTSWHRARSDAAPVLGQWYHLAGVYDLGANQVRLYVNGVHQQTSPGPAKPWHVDGELMIGAAGNTTGDRWDQMVGAIDMVRVYRGVLDPRWIADQGFVPTGTTLRLEAN